MLIGLAFAFGAMLINSGAGLLQSDATRRVRRRRPLIAQPRYLAGLVLDLVGWAATVAALRYLPVYAVQAVLGGAIAVSALAARAFYGTELRRVDRVAIGACLAGLLLLAGSAGEQRPAAASPAVNLVLLGSSVLLTVALVALWQSGRVLPLGVVAGLGFGGTSLAVHALQVEEGENVALALLAQPLTYLVVVFGVIGLAAWSRALGLGSLAQVTAVLLVTEVVVPGLVGIAVLGDAVRAGWWVPAGIGLVLSVAGVVVLARSPAQQPPLPIRVS